MALTASFCNRSMVWVIVNVCDADASLLRVGRRSRAPAGLPGRVFKSNISWVAPSVDPNTHHLLGHVDGENSDRALKLGMLAYFRVITGEAETTPAVQQRAIVYKGDTGPHLGGGRRGAIAARSMRTERTSMGC